ncbi:MAG: hypothetical protein RI947_1545 [Candidatus Parcubacteria bacterium]|jgi:hypothetical protein
MDDTETLPQGDTLHSLENTLDKPDKLTEALESSTSEIIRTDEAAAAEIDAAEKAGAITRTEAQTLNNKRRGCLVEVVAKMSGAVPDRYKPRLQKALSVNTVLEKCYIVGLDPQEDKAELSRLKEIYKYQVIEPLYETKPNPQHIEAAIDKYIVALGHTGMTPEDRKDISEVLGQLYRTEDRENSDMDFQGKVAEKLVLHVINNGSDDIKAEMMVKLLKEADTHAVAYLPLISDTVRTTVINEYVKDYRFFLFSRNKVVFPLIELLPTGQRTDVLLHVADRIPDLKGESFDVDARVALAKQTLSYTDSSNRAEVYEEVIGSTWSPLIDVEEPQKAITLLLELTPVQQEQDLLFGRIVDSDADYRGVEGFDIDAYVARADAGSYTVTNFVLKQIEHGYLSREAMTSFGWKKIQPAMEKGVKDREDIDNLVGLAVRYHVPLDGLRTAVRPHLEARFQEGTIDRRLHKSVVDLGEMAFAQEWSEFEYDIQTTERLGERTWRDEQSLVDLLQNHLDANDLKCALDLGSKIYGSDKMIFMLEHSDEYYIKAVRDLLAVKKEFGDRTDDPDYTVPYQSFISEKGAFVEAVADISPETPSIEICLKTTWGDLHWVPYRNLPYIHKEDAQIVGVRFADNGLGYDEQLNAIFAPTKTGFDFLRGRFGQGAKMSMVRLMNAGCDVKINSSCKLLESGEYIEWEGHPEYSQDTRTVHFKGKRRRLYTTDDSAPSGTTTEIMFDKADGDVVAKIVAMLDMRDDNLGLGKYVREYLPEDIQASYKSAMSYKERSQEEDSLQISLDPRVSGKIFIQGLEVPAHGITTAFSYDFTSKDLFTGADRTWLDVDKVKKEVVKAWAHIKDLDYIKRLQALILDETYTAAQEVLWIDDIGNTLGYDVKDLHIQALKERFKIQDNTQGLVLMTRSEIVDSGMDIVKLVKLGFAIGIVEGNKYQIDKYISKTLSSLHGYRFRTLSAESAKKYIKEEETAKSIETQVVPERIQAELEAILAEVKQRVGSYLTDAGLTDEAKLLSDLDIDIGCAGESGTPAFVKIGQGGNEAEFRIVISSDIFENKQFPETISHADRRCIEFMTEMQILALIGNAGHYVDNRLTSGQDVVNALLHRSVSPQLRHTAEQINITTPDDNMRNRMIYSTSPEKAVDEAHIAVQEAAHNLSSNFATFDEVKESIDIINQHIATGLIDEDQLYTMLSPCILRYICFDGTVYYIGTTRRDQKTASIQLLTVPHDTITSAQGVEMYILNRQSSDMAVALIPYNFATQSGVMLKDSSSEYSLSKYQYTHSIGSYLNDGSSKLSTEDFFKSMFLRNHHLGTNCIYFPIGALSKDTVDNRIAYIKDEYDLTVDLGGGIHSKEKNTGKDYLETTLSEDYGGGKAWDKGIRIFGDIVQNHIDEAGKNVEILYQVIKDGETVWISAEELCQPENSELELAGIRFGDNGRGYTTRQLTILSESTKNGAGQRGKFGTGMKMLTASCVRHNFDLAFSSRDWRASATKRPKTIIQHGVTATKQMVGFEMEWNEREETGSTTELTAPSDMGAQQQHIWKEWMSVVDPRQLDDKGNKGLERYIRSLRMVEDDAIRIGNVKILVNEPGKLYEGGILIPQAVEKMGIKTMFGYDIDDDIIATQERDVVDPDKLRKHLIAAFSKAPTDICEALLTFITTAPDAAYLEYKHIGSVDNKKLRHAYYSLFGDYALLSSADKSRQILASGYNELNKPLSEFERSIHKAIIEFETTHLADDPIVHLDEQSKTNLHQKLSKQVVTTFNLMADLYKRPIPITDQERQPIEQLVRLTAAEMSQRFNTLYETPQGQRLLTMLFASKDRTYIEGDDHVSPEAMLARTDSIGIGVQPVEVLVGSNRVAEAFVHGPYGITYNTKNLADPNMSGGTTGHEILHLTTNTRDYTTTFMGMLMLNVPAIAAHYAS